MSLLSPDNKNRIRSQLVRCLNISAELAELIIMLRDKPGILDWLALGLRSTDIGFRIHEEIQTSRMVSPWQYFGVENDAGMDLWSVLPRVFGSLIIPQLRSKRRVSWSQDEESSPDEAWEASIENCRLGYMVRNEKVMSEYIYVWKDDESKIYEILHELLWTTIKTPHAVISPLGMVDDTLEAGAVHPTNLVSLVTDRIGKFLAASKTRSYLLSGEPGTGKTTCIQHVIHTAGLRSLRLPLTELMKDDSPRRFATEQTEMWLNTVIEITRPDALIIDDIDRVDKKNQAKLIDTIDLARKRVKVLIASANEIQNVIAPLRRPQRFDDLISVPPLEKETVSNILGDETEVLDIVLDWPIAYIYDYLERVKVLGRDSARLEIMELKHRLEAVRAKV